MLKIRFSIIVSLALILSSLPAIAGSTATYEECSASKQQPLYKNEEFKFVLKWGLMRVGNATLSHLYDSHEHSFELQASSNWLVDLIFPVKTYIKSTCSSDFERSFTYSKNYIENDRERNFTVEFDWKNKKVSRFNRLKNSTKNSTLKNVVIDPLSVFFVFRMGPKNRDMTRIVSDGQRLVLGKAKFIEKEFISVPFGKFESMHYQIDLGSVDGIFFTRNYTPYEVWVSNDQSKIPLKIEAPIRIGPFSGTLTGSLYKTE